MDKSIISASASNLNGGSSGSDMNIHITTNHNISIKSETININTKYGDKNSYVSQETKSETHWLNEVYELFYTAMNNCGYVSEDEYIEDIFPSTLSEINLEHDYCHDQQIDEFFLEIHDDDDESFYDHYRSEYTNDYNDSYSSENLTNNCIHSHDDDIQNFDNDDHEYHDNNDNDYNYNEIEAAGLNYDDNDDNYNEIEAAGLNNDDNYNEIEAAGLNNDDPELFNDDNDYHDCDNYYNDDYDSYYDDDYDNYYDDDYDDDS